MKKQPLEIPLWPEGALPPSKAIERVENRGTPAKPDRCVYNVQSPTLTAYWPEPERACGTAVIIFPGGAYEFLAIDKEGHQVALWLQTLGIAGLVLKYRLPTPESLIDKPPSFLDADRAIRLVRSQASQCRLQPNRIGLLGFSAGAHLASLAGTRFSPGVTDSPDPVQRVSSRPDFMVLVYPVISVIKPFFHARARTGLMGPNPPPELCESFSSELHVSPETPPTFLVHAKDDHVHPEHSLCFYEALQKARVPAELHLFEEGGHGYGLGIRGGEVATWPKRCAAWLKNNGFLYGHP